VVWLPGGGSQCSAQAAPLAVVYEDREVLVVDKPAGLVVHPGPGQSGETLLSAILAHCPSVGLSDDSVRPGIAHRLDKNTSGLMVVAKNDAAREHLVSQFKDRSVTKEYLVLVKGRLSPKEGVIEGPIGRNPRSRVRMAIVVGGKDASTRYRVREYVGDHSLIEVVPVTGRTHQIRVHLSAIGHPVVGDSTYGVSSPVVDRQFVHAHRLGFRLPSNRQYREFTSPLPSDLSEALRLLGARV